MTRVLIADDHALVRDGLRHILSSANGLEVAGEASDGATTMAMIRATPADVLVLDLSMPGRNGVELLKQIKDEKPPLRILVLTMHAEQQYAVRAFKAGASGYLTKESASAELVTAVSKVAAGGVYVSLAMAERLASRNFEFVVLAVNIQRQVGGSLAEILDMVADTVREREQFSRKVKALTAMGRASAYVLVGMPFFIGAALAARPRGAPACSG